MNIWWLAIKDTLLLCRDRKALLTLILMPILLIGILGAAFGNLFSGEEAKIDTFKLGIANKDEGEMGLALKNDVFAKGLADLVEVKIMNEKQLYTELKEQKVAVGLVIGKDFSKSIMAGEETAVNLVSNPSASIQTMIIENVIQQFAREASMQTAGIQLAIEAAAKEGKPADIEKLRGGNSLEREILIQEKAPGKEEKTVSSFQYYAAGMAVMFLLMTVVNGVSSMIEEKEQEVYKRLLVSKLTHFEYLIGKFAGLFLLSLIQMSIIILGTKFIFDVDWGNSLGGIILVGLCFVFSACGLGVMAGSLVNTGKAFETAGMLGTQLMAAVGGSMIPLYVFPDWVNTMVRIFPNALALQSFLALMSGEGTASVLTEALVLLGLGSLFLLIGLARLSAERRVKYA